MVYVMIELVVLKDMKMGELVSTIFKNCVTSFMDDPYVLLIAIMK